MYTKYNQATAMDTRAIISAQQLNNKHGYFAYALVKFSIIIPVIGYNHAQHAYIIVQRFSLYGAEICMN